MRRYEIDASETVLEFARLRQNIDEFFTRPNGRNMRTVEGWA